MSFNHRLIKIKSKILPPKIILRNMEMHRSNKREGSNIDTDRDTVREYVKPNLIRGVKRVDIGCGSPDQTYKGCFSIDINPQYNPDLLHNCENGLPFEDNSLEFVNSDNSLEHFRNPFFILQECYRCMKKRGKMRLVVPNCQYFPLVIINLFYDIDKFWYWYMHLKFKCERTVHYTLFTMHLICNLVKEAGFKIKSKKGFLYSKEIELILEK